MVSHGIGTCCTSAPPKLTTTTKREHRKKPDIYIPILVVGKLSLPSLKRVQTAVCQYHCALSPVILMEVTFVPELPPRWTDDAQWLRAY